MQVVTESTEMINVVSKNDNLFTRLCYWIFSPEFSAVSEYFIETVTKEEEEM